MDMNACSQCGRQRQGFEKKCPRCNVFYSKIDEFLAEEQAKEERYAFKTRIKRVMKGTDRKQAFWGELEQIYQAMPKGSLWVLYVVLTFIFALMMVVI
jgi:predicted ATP-dependent serine protease